MAAAQSCAHTTARDASECLAQDKGSCPSDTIVAWLCIADGLQDRVGVQCQGWHVHVRACRVAVATKMAWKPSQSTMYPPKTALPHLLTIMSTAAGV